MKRIWANRRRELKRSGNNIVIQLQKNNKSVIINPIIKLYYIKYYLFQVQEQLIIHHEQVSYL